MNKWDEKRRTTIEQAGSANAKAGTPTPTPAPGTAETQRQAAVPSAVPQQAVPSAAQQPQQQAQVTQYRAAGQQPETPSAAQGAGTQPAAAPAAAPAPTWDGGRGQEIDALFAEITGRQPFSYRIDEDAMWNSLKDDYRRMGQDAMRDTMGQAAALTGGYGSSYSQGVGQRAYDDYMTKLSERAPELMDRAYQRYQDEGEDMYRRLSELRDLDRDAYDRYIDDYSRWERERSYQDERADTEWERAQREREYQDSREDTEYNRQRQERSTLLSLLQTGYNPTDDELAKAGMTREQADQFLQLWKAGDPETAYRLGLISAEDYYAWTGQYAPGHEPATGGGGGTGAGSGEPSLDERQAQLDQMIADGEIDPYSYEAITYAMTYGLKIPKKPGVGGSPATKPGATPLRTLT